jgi:RNA polymerase sigma-70 factor (ECF subfamily)
MSLQHKKNKFSLLFDKHYKRLFNYSFKMIKKKDLSEELVQETFIKLWENFENINDSNRSIESFLIVTLKNKIIDDYRKNKTRDKHTNLYTLHANLQEEIDNEWEISQQIDVIYAELHPKTLEIFQLSRDKGLTYKEISIQKNISIKTVESHISKALNTFRKGLKDYL